MAAKESSAANEQAYPSVLDALKKNPTGLTKREYAAISIYAAMHSGHQANPNKLNLPAPLPEQAVAEADALYSKL